MNPCSHTLPCRPGWLSETISVNLTRTAVTSGTHTHAHTLIQAYTFFSLFPMHLTLSLAMWCMLMKAEAHVCLRFKLSLTCSAAETVCMSPVTLLPCLVYKQIERPCRCQLNFLLGSFDDI